MCNAECLFAVDGVTNVECRFEQRRKRTPDPSPAEGTDDLNFFPQPHDANAEKCTTQTLKDSGKAATTEGATGAQQVRFPLPLAKRWAILLMPSFRNTAVIRL